MNELTRAELIEMICPADTTYDCNQGNCSSSCDKCEDILNYLIDRYDAKVREDAERDFQNSDYWNDYLADVIKKAKIDAIDECIRITNECCWKDANMLVELFDRMKEEKK